MGDGFDTRIELHRRDPDPHPRWKKAIDAHFTEIEETIALLTPGGEVPVIPDAGTATPQPVAHGVPAQAGSAAPFSREDHRHALQLPPSVEAIANITGTGVVQRDGEGVLRAIQQTNDLVGVWDLDGLSSRPGFSATEDLVTVPSLKATDQAGTDERVVLAQADGTQRAEAQAVWTPGTPDTVDNSAGAGWSPISHTPDNSIVTAAAHDGIVILGCSGFGLGIYRSTDNGATWTNNASLWGGVAPSIATVMIVRWTGTEFMMLGNNGSGSSMCATSPDGITWTLKNTGFAGFSDWEGLASDGAGKVVAVAWGSTSARVSTNGGTTWTSHAIGLSALLGVIYNNGRFIACGNNGVAWSADGVTWTAITSGALAAHTNWYGVAANGNNLVAVGYGVGTAVSSDNGSSWSAGGNLPATVSPNVRDIVFSNGYFCCMGSSYSTRSNDNGATWETPSSITNNVAEYAVSSTHIIAAGGTGANAILRSSNGSVPGTDALMTFGPNVNLDVDGLIHGNSVQVDDQAGTGVRLVAAGANGTQEALANPGTQGSYGAASKTLTETVDLQGRVSAIAAIPIQIAQAQVTGLVAALPPLVPRAGSSFGGFPNANLAIPANQHRVTLATFMLGV